MRFYDRNKYTEICCEKHLSMIKDEYIGNKTIMNPTMAKKLSYLENILTVIINSQEPKNACSLFKLLTLDLSPCLTLFIINIFIKAFQKTIKTVKWKDQLIMELINNKYEVIIVNSFLYALPEIRFQILQLMNEIHLRLLTIGKGAYFIPFEKMIKTCFLPQKMFYYLKDDNNNNKTNNKTNNKNNNKNDNNNNNNNENNNNKDIKRFDSRTSSIKVSKKENETNISNNIMPAMTLGLKQIVEIQKEIQPRKKGNSILDRINNFNNNATKNNQTNKISDKLTIKNKDNKENKNNQSIKIFNKPIANNKGSKDKKNNKDIKEKQDNIKTSNANKPFGNSSNNNNFKPEIENNNIKNKNDNKENEIKENKINGVLIFKDNLLKEYKDNLFTLFYLWALGLKLNDDINKINFEKTPIKNTNIIEILFAYIKELNDINYTNKFLEKLQLFVSNPQSSYTIFSNKKIYSIFLDFTFSFYS